MLPCITAITDSSVSHTHTKAIHINHNNQELLEKQMSIFEEQKISNAMDVHAKLYSHPD